MVHNDYMDVLLFILLILTIAIAAILVGPLNYSGLIYTPILEEKVGGAYRKTHIIVDTLNLTHWMGTDNDQITFTNIINTIDRATPILRQKYSNIIYVLKDQDTQHNSSEIRAAYQNAAERNRVIITCAERYVESSLEQSLVPKLGPHSANGRDDFYMCILAARNRCAVASEDRLRDFAEFRKNIPPFHVIEFAYWRAIPLRDSIRPSSGAYSRLRKPIMIRFAALGLSSI